MIDALENIIRFLFEPVFGLMILGIAFAAKKGIKQPAGGWIAAVLVTAVVGRLALGMASARYSGILLFAGAGFAAYCLWQIPVVFCEMTKIAFNKKICNAVSVGLIIILTFACLGKIFRYPNNMNVMPNMKVLSGVLRHKDLVFAVHRPNYSYYLNRHKVEEMPEEMKDMFSGDYNGAVELMRKFLDGYKYYDGNVFLIVDLPGNMSPVSAADLRLNENDLFECIAIAYKSGKKNSSKEAVYRYRPDIEAHRLTGVKNFDFKNSIYPNGNFEYPLEQKRAELLKEEYLRKNFTQYSNDELLMPIGVTLDTAECPEKEDGALLVLTGKTDEKINGRYSLKFETVNRNRFFLAGIRKNDYSIRFFMRGGTEKPGCLEVYTITEDGAGELTRRNLAKISFDRETALYEINLKKEDFRNKEQMWIYFELEDNCVIIDDIMIEDFNSAKDSVI